MRGRAFTLIELLVVIAIVAILAGMLLPAINLVKKSAQATRCTSALRQIGVAAFGYANDNDNLLVWAWGLGSDPWSVRLAEYLDAWAGAPATNPNSISRTSVIWGCPIVPRDPVTVWSKCTGFGMNLFPYCDSTDGWTATDRIHNAWLGRMGCYNWGDFRDIPLGPITYQSSRPMFAEAAQSVVGNDAGWHIYDQNFAEYRHSSKASTVFYDGHAAGLNRANMQTACYKPGLLTP